MKRRALLLSLVILALLPAASIAQDATPEAVSGTPTAVESDATVFVRESGTLGRYLSTPDGIALYVTDNDTVAEQSSCTGDCTIAWIPFSADDPLALPADVSGALTRFERADGSTQLAYNGMPLYTYNADLGPGSTLGDGVGGVWWLATPGDQLGVPATPVAPTAVDMGTPRAAGSVTVSMREFFIQSASVTFQTGVEYTFEVINLGSAEHQFVVEPAGARGAPIQSDTGPAQIDSIGPGESATLVVVFDQPGRYQLASHTGTDYEQGMALDITVI